MQIHNNKATKSGAWSITDQAQTHRIVVEVGQIFHAEDIFHDHAIVEKQLNEAHFVLAQRLYHDRTRVACEQTDTYFQGSARYVREIPIWLEQFLRVHTGGETFSTLFWHLRSTFTN